MIKWIAVIAGLVLVICTGCKREFDCLCTQNIQQQVGGLTQNIVTGTNYTIEAYSESAAEEECKAHESVSTNLQGVNQTITTTCAIQ